MSTVPRSRSIESGGHPIRLEAYYPGTPGPHPAILLLHGSGGNTGFWLDRMAPAVTRMGVALVSVHYFDRTNTVRADATLLQDGIHVPLWLEAVRDTLTHLTTDPAIDAHRIALLGVSLGAFLALALAAGPNPGQQAPPTPPIRAIVEISGGLVPPYAPRATSAFPPTLIIHGSADDVVPVNHAQTLAQLLTRLNVPHHSLILPNQGHWFSPAAQPIILESIATFLTQHL